MSAATWYATAAVVGLGGAFLGLVVHEVAHAVPTLLAGHGAHVTIGSDSGRTVRLGRLSFTVGYDGPRKLLVYGHYWPDGSPSPRVQVASTAAGPLATVAMVVIVGGVLYRGGVPEPVRWGLAYVFASDAYRAVLTIVPTTYSRGPYAGEESDGKRILQLVRS